LTYYADNTAQMDAMFNPANGLSQLTSAGSASIDTILNWNYAGYLTNSGISIPNGGDNFSFEVSGTFVPQESGDYSFGVTSDDGSDVIIDGVVVTSQYGGHGMGGYSYGTIALVKGTSYTFKARMQEYGGGEGLGVVWKRPSQLTYSLQSDELFSASQPPALQTARYDDSALPTVFSPGKGTFSVPFYAAPGDVITWTLASSYYSGYDPSDPNGYFFRQVNAGPPTRVLPALSCIQAANPATNGGYDYVANFTYTSDNLNPVSPVINNLFVLVNGCEIDLSQLPAQFEPGTHSFQVPFRNIGPNANSDAMFAWDFQFLPDGSTDVRAATHYLITAGPSSTICQSQPPVVIPSNTVTTGPASTRPSTLVDQVIADRAYPNPVSSTVTVETGLAGVDERNIQVFDLLGRLYHPAGIRKLGGGRWEINLGNLLTGQYNIRVPGSVGVKVFRIVKN